MDHDEPGRDGTVVERVDRPPSALVAGYREVDVASVHESLDRGDTLLDEAIRCLMPGARVVGPAVTARNLPGDNLAMHVALDLAGEGDVLVVGEGTGDAATWGSVAARCAAARKLAGVVVDGSVRDLATIRESGPPVWARRVSPRRPQKEQVGGVNVPVVCGGVLVRPGDLVVGDDDGVVVVPAGVASETLARAVARLEAEARMGSELDAGRSPFAINGMAALLAGTTERP